MVHVLVVLTEYHGCGVGEIVGVKVGVGVAVSVGVLVGVGVSVLVRVGKLVLVGSGVKLAVAVFVGVMVGLQCAEIRLVADSNTEQGVAGLNCVFYPARWNGTNR
jgi:hypothetical protein